MDNCINCGSQNLRYQPHVSGYTEPLGLQLEPDDGAGYECMECYEWYSVDDLVEVW